MKPEKSQKSLSHFSWTPYNPVTVPAPCSAPFLPKKMHQKKWIHQPQDRLRGEKEGLSREAPALAGTATNLPPHGNGRLGPVPGLPQSWLPSPRALPHGCREGCCCLLRMVMAKGDPWQALVPAREEEDGAAVPGQRREGNQE